ncbi:MAG: hypothetical protein P8M61_00200 [Crocinitomicaceae bacterium]|jgi:hypothetical protein|nr:hypothetical protein [Crocinitomicaceae bacterium]MDG2463483.1 hypothetical protein [Crocinitomicaceae bacterium]
MEKDNYIEKVLSSKRSLNSIEVSDYVWTRIQGQLSIVEDKISMGKVWMMAFGLSALFLFNLTSIYNSSSENSSLNSANGNSEMFDSSVTDFYTYTHE